MNTVFQTGPGFYAADTRKVDNDIADDVLRVYCVRLEAYDIQKEEGGGITFEIVFAKCEKDPRLAKALLKLADAIEGNRELLEEFIK